MKLYYTFLLRVASIRFLAVWLLVYAASLTFFMVPLQEKVINGSDSGLIDLMPFFSKTDFFQALVNYGDTGRAAYLENWYYDFLYPFVYMVLMYVLIGLSFKRIKLPMEKGVFWMYVPMFAVCIDYAENLTFLSIIRSFPEQDPVLFWIAFTFSSLKWTAVYAVVIRVALTFFKKKAV